MESQKHSVAGDEITVSGATEKVSFLKMKHSLCVFFFQVYQSYSSWIKINTCNGNTFIIKSGLNTFFNINHSDKVSRLKFLKF